MVLNNQNNFEFLSNLQTFTLLQTHQLQEKTEQSNFFSSLFTDSSLSSLFTTLIATGIGVAFGNNFANFVVYRTRIRDVSKVYNLLIENQIKDISYMIKLFDNLERYIFLYDIYLFTSLSEGNRDNKKLDKRKFLINFCDRIKYWENNIRKNDIYNNQIQKIELFKGKTLNLLTNYFISLKNFLEETTNFINYEFPNNITDFELDHYLTKNYKLYLKILQLFGYITICYGLFSKNELISRRQVNLVTRGETLNKDYENQIIYYYDNLKKLVIEFQENGLINNEKPEREKDLIKESYEDIKKMYSEFFFNKK